MGTRSQDKAHGPLAGHVEIVRTGLLEAGYAPGTITGHLALLRLLDQRCVAVHVGLQELTDARLEELLLGARADDRPVTLRRMGPVLGPLRIAGLIRRPPRRCWTRGVCWSPNTGSSCVRSAGWRCPRCGAASSSRTRFCRAMLAGHGPGWQVRDLRVEDLHGFLFEHASRCSVAGTRTVAETLRCFCRFLFAAGHTQRDLSGTVPAPAGFRQCQLPKAVDEITVAALLASCDPSSVAGLRDLAVMTLMLRLGLRANEIACMTLEDLHWRIGEIEVHGKAGRRDRLPLPADVGAVLVDYLQAGIDTSSIALWLGHANTRSTQAHLYADMTMKEAALAATAPPDAHARRYQPSDQLLAFLEAL